MAETQMAHIRLTERDRERLKIIREAHGCVSDSAAVRKALEVAANWLSLRQVPNGETK